MGPLRRSCASPPRVPRWSPKSSAERSDETSARSVRLGTEETFMTFSRIFAATLLAALPLSADVRERAVVPVGAVTITGVVRDANGNPVAGAIVHSGTFYSYRNGTGPDGKYSLTLPGDRPTLITVEDFAYEP